MARINVTVDAKLYKVLKEAIKESNRSLSGELAYRAAQYDKLMKVTGDKLYKIRKAIKNEG